MDAETMEFAPAPIADNGVASSVEPPKRRGRPALSEEEKARRAAERAANPERPRGRQRSKQSIAEPLANNLAMFNILFGFLPEPWNGDAFSETEILALSKALDDFAQTHARVYRYLNSMLLGGNASTINLVLVIGGIANVRMQRHGISVASLLGFNTQQASQPQYEEPVEYAAATA
jgi:hypothetical protein